MSISKLTVSHSCLAPPLDFDLARASSPNTTHTLPASRLDNDSDNSNSAVEAARIFDTNRSSDEGSEGIEREKERECVWMWVRVRVRAIRDDARRGSV